MIASSLRAIFMTVLVHVMFMNMISAASIAGITDLCPKQASVTRPHELLKLIENKYYLVLKSQPLEEERKHEFSSEKIISSGKGTRCNWEYESDFDSARIPAEISKAVCNNCPMYCKAVEYTIVTTVQKCDDKMKKPVRVQQKMTVPVAFIYDSNN